MSIDRKTFAEEQAAYWAQVAAGPPHAELVKQLAFSERVKRAEFERAEEAEVHVRQLEAARQKLANDLAEARAELNELRIEVLDAAMNSLDVGKKVDEIDMSGTPDERIGNILAEADKLTSLDRQATYGHPRENIGRTATLWNAYLGTKLSARQVALCMVLVKVARESHQEKRDNLVDIAGWARVAELVEQ